MKIMANSRNPEELKHYWNEFRRKTGRKYKELFIQSVDQDNEWAKRIGYTNKGEYNIAMYEDKNLVENLEKEIKKFQPFYQQIHAYVRKKLIHYYPNVTILPDGPIPAHLL
ncbi:Angiotensin-converting enzyme, partial [Araneus ventricosus]